MGPKSAIETEVDPVAIPANAVKVSFNGHLTGGEIFSFGSWWDPGMVLNATQLDNLRTTVTTAFESNLGAQSRIQLDAGSGYDTTTAYYYDGSSSRAALQAEGPYSHAGTSSGSDMPLQTCCVATLLTGRPGRSYRGRIYFPYLEGALTAHQFVDTFCSGMASDVAGWFETVKTASGGGFLPAVPVVMSSTKSAMTPVTEVRVDSKPDRQERRDQKSAILHAESAAVA